MLQSTRDHHQNKYQIILHKTERNIVLYKKKVKYYPRTVHEGPEGGSRGIALLFL